MAFVDVNTGKKISLSKGYESRTIPYDEWRRQQEEKRAAGGTDSRGTASPRLGMTGVDVSGEARTRAVPSQTRVPAPKAGPADDIWARGSRYSGIGSNPAAVPSRPASYQAGQDDYRDTWAQGLTGTERRERKEDVHRRLAELAGQAQQARVDLDTDTLNRVNDRMKALRASIGEQTLGDRANDTASGIFSGSAGDLTNLVGTVANAFNDPAYYRRQIVALQKRLEAGGYSDGRRFVRDTEEGRQRIRDSIREMADKAWQLERPTSFVNRTYQLADQMTDDSARSIASAKEGLGAAGQLAVDLGVAGGQMGLDGLASAIIPGAGGVLAALRSAGSSAREARLAGADLDQQLLAAAGSGLITYGTGRLSNLSKPFQKIYGKGAAETIAGRLAGKFGESTAMQMLTRFSSSAGGRILLSGLGEAAEENVEGLLQAAWDRFVYDPDAEYTLEEAKQDALVAGILGAFGGVPEGISQIGSRLGGNQAETGAGAEIQAPAGVDAPSDRGGLQGVQEGPGTVRGQAPEAAPVQAAPAQRDVIMEAAARGGRLEAETRHGVSGDVVAPGETAGQQTAAPGTRTEDTLVQEAQRLREADPKRQTPAENTFLKDDDLDDYLRVGERKHVRDLKEGQLRQGQSPILTSISQVKAFIRSALSGNVKNTIKAYGRVGSRMAGDIQTAGGGDVSGYYLELDANRMQHLADHITDDGDIRNIPLTQEQAENLTSYIDTYDDVLDLVKRKDGSVRVTLGKRINGHAVIVELISKGRQSLQPVTAWQNTTEHYLKKYGNSKAQSVDASQPLEGAKRGYKPTVQEASETAPVSTVSHPLPDVKVESDPLMTALFGEKKRVDQAALSPEQFDRLADLNEQGTVGMDAAGRVYQVDPAEHIDWRSMDGVGGKGLNAFSFDHPELHGYFKRAAEALIADADLSMQFPAVRRYERGAQGRQVSQGAEVSAHLRQAMDETGLSRAQLIDAAKRIVEDHGQENAAAAKRVEIILDDMLENGWTAMTGKSVPSNQAYIDAKSRIAGSRAGEARESYIPPELDADDGLGAADAGSLSSAFERMQAQTDTFHPINEDSARRIMEEQSRAPSEVPVTDPETGRNITKTVSTILNSPLTSPEMAVEIENAVSAGGFDYIPVTDKGAVQWAQADIADRGLNRVADEFLTRVDLGQRIRKNDIAAAMECYNQALAAGDRKTAFDLAAAISEAVHDGAQVTQAMNLMNRLSPEGRLLTLRRYVDKLNRSADSKGARKGAERAGDTDAARADFVEQSTGFRISDELAENYLLAETDAERSAAWDAITTDLAEQIPSTFLEKANFIRYTSMLLNPTTHVRNFLGNGIQAGARTIKNGVGAAIERAIIKDQTQRTKSILFGKEGKALREFARGQYGADQDAAMGAGKYSDAGAAGIEREIQSKRKAFQGTNPISKGIQAIGDFNSNALDLEDLIFNRSAYVDAFAQALKAKGVTAAEAAGGAKADLVESARATAIEEARRATYRNTTALSETLSKLGRYDPNANTVEKGLHFAADAFLPFRRTPSNILTTGMDYSPLGILKAAKQGLYDLKRGNATAADVVDSLSAGLTGTGIMALGAWLAAEGLLRVSLGDDDREEAYNKDRGAQKYALQLGGKSYTLDWASPSAMPLLAGASVMESAMDGGSTFEAVMDAMTGISDVVLETSMLSSLNDLISNWSYADNKVTYVLDRAASGYLGQYVPTVGGKLASTADGTVRKSYVETGTGQVASDVDYFLQGVEKKIPGALNTLQPKIDLWGEEVSNGKLPERVFKNFLSPGNLNMMDNSGIDRELRRLEESVGSSAVYPAAVGKSFTVDGERKELTAEEYTKYARKVGQTRRQLVEELMNSEGYKRLDDANRAAVIASAYEYAGDLGKMEVSGYVPRSGSVTEGALKSPLPTAVYLLYRNSSDRDGNGRTSAAESAQTLMEMEGLTDKQKGEAWSAFNNKGETEESRERKEAKNPFTGVLAGDYSPEEVVAAWGIFDGKGTKEERYTEERKKRDLQEELGVSAREANELFALMKRAAGG